MRTVIGSRDGCLIRQEIVGIVDQRAWTKAERKEAKAKRQLVALAKDWAQ